MREVGQLVSEQYIDSSNEEEYIEPRDYCSSPIHEIVENDMVQMRIGE